MVLQALEIVKIGVLFPFFSVAYIIAPHCVVGQTMRKPFIKFICHSASYFTFLCEYSPPSSFLFFFLYSTFHPISALPVSILRHSYSCHPSCISSSTSSLCF